MGKRNKDGRKELDTVKVKRTKNNKKQIKYVPTTSTKDLGACQVRSDEIPKKIVFDDAGTPSIRKNAQIDSTVSNKHSDNHKSFKDVRSKTKSTGNSKNKKIIFSDEDDEDQQIPVNNMIDRKNTQINQNEDEVKDEDIDKFCDELEEEDNNEYENWVKLIEAKLSSNKKKS